MLSTWDNSTSEPVRRPNKGGEVHMVQKPRVIINYNKNVGGVDVADLCALTCCSLCKSLKWWIILFFWDFEAAVINA
jgi:hypothetical protein